MSPSLAALVVRECKASEFSDCDVVFSGLDSDVAGEIGKRNQTDQIPILSPPCPFFLFFSFFF